MSNRIGFVIFALLLATIIAILISAGIYGAIRDRIRYHQGQRRLAAEFIRAVNDSFNTSVTENYPWHPSLQTYADLQLMLVVQVTASEGRLFIKHDQWLISHANKWWVRWVLDDNESITDYSHIEQWAINLILKAGDDTYAQARHRLIEDGFDVDYLVERFNRRRQALV